MTKEDLSCGNVVKTRCGEKFIFNYIEGKPYFICLNGAGFNPAKYYKNDLSIGDTNGEYDIMKVYKDYTCQELLWGRKEPIKLTEDEKVILRNIDKRYKYIKRDNTGYLVVYKDDLCVSYYIYIFNHLDNKQYLIENLLKEQDDE